jgi:hypothetical protein
MVSVGGQASSYSSAEGGGAIYAIAGPRSLFWSGKLVSADITFLGYLNETSKLFIHFDNTFPDGKS